MGFFGCWKLSQLFPEFLENMFLFRLVLHWSEQHRGQQLVPVWALLNACNTSPAQSTCKKNTRHTGTQPSCHEWVNWWMHEWLVRKKWIIISIHFGQRYRHDSCLCGCGPHNCWLITFSIGQQLVRQGPGTRTHCSGVQNRRYAGQSKKLYLYLYAHDWHCHPAPHVNVHFVHVNLCPKSSFPFLCKCAFGTSSERKSFKLFKLRSRSFCTSSGYL